MADWPRAVIFDFDGVLVHSEPLHYLAFKSVADREHLTLTEDLYYNELIGYDDRGVVLKLLQLNKKPTTPAVLLRLLAEKQEIARRLIHEKKFEALAGVEEVVRGLWRNYPLAICSGAIASEIELMLDAVRLRDCFRLIISADDVAVGKPDPACYLKCIADLGQQLGEKLSPKDCIVFEDAPRVIDRLKPLGFACVGVAGHIPESRFEGASAIVTGLTPEQIKSKLPQLELYEELKP